MAEQGPLRVILLDEGGDVAPKRLWDELPSVVAARNVDLMSATVLDPGALAPQWDAMRWRWVWLGAETARGYPRAAARLAWLSHRRQIDVIQGTGPIAGFVAALAGRLGARGLSVFHRQGEAFEHHPRMEQLSRFAGTLAPLTLACSAATARYATEVDRTPARRVRVAHNAANRLDAADPAAVEALRHTLGIAADTDTVVSISWLRPEKGLDNLIAALPQVRLATGRPLVCVIAGTGVCAEALQRQADTVADDNLRVIFPGAVRDVGLWFSLADVATIPSRREPFGVAAAEAMMCSRALVAGRVGGLTEVVADGETGLLVDPESPAEIAAGLASLLNDRERAARYGRAGRERALTRFSNEAMVDAWIAAWREFGAQAPKAR